MAYMRSCSNLSCMYRYEVFECATKYVGVMSVTKIAPPSGLPSVRHESDAYNLGAGRCPDKCGN